LPLNIPKPPTHYIHFSGLALSRLLPLRHHPPEEQFSYPLAFFPKKYFNNDVAASIISNKSGNVAKNFSTFLAFFSTFFAGYFCRKKAAAQVFLLFLRELQTFIKGIC
jgi:hypothetical protein